MIPNRLRVALVAFCLLASGLSNYPLDLFGWPKCC